MNDNLKELTDDVDVVVPMGGGVASVKVVNDNPHRKLTIEKLGRYTGFPFVSGRSPDGPITAGQWFWNNNAMNKTDAFDITLSKFTYDGNDIERILKLSSTGSIIHFKDFLGRSTTLEFISYINVDDVLTINAKGFAENTDYNYQLDELEPCMVEFIQKKPSKNYQFGEFQIFKRNGNTAEEVEENDLVIGFISENEFIKATYVSGDTSDIASYNVIEKLEF